jgi:VWFA-related protein
MRAVSLPLVIFTVFICTGLLRSQDSSDNIRVDVKLAQVDFTVTNAEGKPVTDLNRYDFEILDNGEPRPMQNFSYVKTPYSVVILLDCSESIRGQLVLLVSSVARFADHLQPGSKIVLALFGTDIEIVIDWNGTSKAHNIPDFPICHGTNFYNALDWAEKKLQGVSGRHAVVAFTDGRDSDIARKELTIDGLKVRRVVPPEEDREFQKILKTARAGGAPLYFIAVDTDLNPGKEFGGAVPDLQQFRARMQILSDGTGGRIVFPNEPGDAAGLFPQINQDLGIAYSIGFAPTKIQDGTPRKIKIRVRGEDSYQVHQSRDSYIVN